MSKTVKQAANAFLMSAAIECGERVGRAVGRRIAKAIDQRKKKKKVQDGKSDDSNSGQA